MIDFLWHSVVAQIGLGMAIVAALCAAAWFLPVFRKQALIAAGAVFSVLLIYGKGAKDARDRERKREREAEQEAIRRGNANRVAASRDAADGVRDGYQRQRD